MMTINENLLRRAEFNDIWEPATRIVNWEAVKHFTSDELLTCQCQPNLGLIGKCRNDLPFPEHTAQFLTVLQHIREEYGDSMPITSGYRCMEHPIEARKDEPGAHYKGLAVDVGVRGEDVMPLMIACWRTARWLADVVGHANPTDQGLTIGINQKGAWKSRFVHIGLWSAAAPLVENGRIYVYTY